MSETPVLPRTARRSAQLVAASERTTLDPFVDVDWSVPIDDSAYHLPPEWLPLYGTPAWEAMTEPERDRLQPARDRRALRRRHLVREHADAGRAAPPGRACR